MTNNNRQQQRIVLHEQLMVAKANVYSDGFGQAFYFRPDNGRMVLDKLASLFIILFRISAGQAALPLTHFTIRVHPLRRSAILSSRLLFNPH